MSGADISTDVLVIGGGLAGLRAAIAARDAGARVVVAVKGKLGRSGCSAMTTAGYAASLPGQGHGDNPRQHATDTLSGGGDVGDPELIEILCNETEGEIAYLEKLGGQFKRAGDGYYQSASADHSRPRVLLTPNHLGTDLTLPLAIHADSIGVERLEFVMVTELVTDDSGVCGAVGFNFKDKKFISVAAGAVVLAAGGAGRLFTMTSNPNDITGDGFALAAKAGARMRDMEFIQFYPWRCIDPFDKARVSVQPSTFVMGARLYNSADERFMVGFNPNGAEATTRDIGARGIFDQMRKGLGVRGGVRLDLSPLSEADFERSNPKIARYLKGMNIDHATYPFILSPEAHYWMGGVAIDRHGATSIPRLFAAGETASGIHGANRLNSNALPDTVVFGARAGAAAARAAKMKGDAAIVARTKGWMEKMAFGTPVTESDLISHLKTLRVKMWDHLGIIRNAGGLEAGLRYVRDLRGGLQEQHVVDAKNFRAWLELIFLCDTAEQSLLSALARKESRGAHFREDFPLSDDRNWHGSVMLERGQDQSYSSDFVPRRIHDAA